MAKSFAFKFLPFAIRQPRHLVDYRRHFAFIILNECHLRAIDCEEEIWTLLGKHHRISCDLASQVVVSSRLSLCARSVPDRGFGLRR